MKATEVSSQEVALMKKDLQIEQVQVRNAKLELENKHKQIDDLKMAHENELTLVKSKLQRQMEEEIDEEKQAAQREVEEMH